MKLNGMKTSLDTLMTAAIADRVGAMLWGMSENAGKPASFVEAIYGIEGKREIRQGVTAFESAAGFEAARKEIIAAGREGK